MKKPSAVHCRYCKFALCETVSFTQLEMYQNSSQLYHKQIHWRHKRNVEMGRTGQRQWEMSGRMQIKPGRPLMFWQDCGLPDGLSVSVTVGQVCQVASRSTVEEKVLYVTYLDWIEIVGFEWRLVWIYCADLLFTALWGLSDFAAAASSVATVTAALVQRCHSRPDLK